MSIDRLKKYDFKKLIYNFVVQAHSYEDNTYTRIKNQKCRF